MANQNLNRVTITGNLTRDPELRATGGGTSVCSMRIAVNGRRKDETGAWVDKPNFVDVVAFGATAENAARYLEKGRPVAIDGRLSWSEWEQDGQRRQRLEVAADFVQFLSAPDRDRPAQTTSPGAVQVDDDFGDQPARPAAADEDIPF